jgi:hypothetical protein
MYDRISNDGIGELIIRSRNLDAQKTLRCKHRATVARSLYDIGKVQSFGRGTTRR